MDEAHLGGLLQQRFNGVSKERYQAQPDRGLTQEALKATIAAANAHNTKLLREMIEAIVVKRPEPFIKDPWCLDSF